MNPTAPPLTMADAGLDLAKLLDPVHRRDLELELAAKELKDYVGPWITKHNLTMFEYLYLLGVLQHKQVHQGCLLERQQAGKR